MMPKTLPALFRILAGAPVKARLVSTGRAGDVVPMVVELALRLCRGGSLDTVRQRRRHFRDVRRELRRRDESSEEDLQELDHEQEKAVEEGIGLLRPHVDVLLESLKVLVQQRLKLKGKRVFVATPMELALLASASEWCQDAAVAKQLVQLLVTVLVSNKRPGARLLVWEPLRKGLSSDSQQLMTSSLRRLVFAALPLDDGTQTAFLIDAVPRLLRCSEQCCEWMSERGHVKDVAVRQELGLLLWEVEAIKARGSPKSIRKAQLQGVSSKFSIQNGVQPWHS